MSRMSMIFKIHLTMLEVPEPLKNLCAAHKHFFDNLLRHLVSFHYQFFNIRKQNFNPFCFFKSASMMRQMRTRLRSNVNLLHRHCLGNWFGGRYLLDPLNGKTLLHLGMTTCFQSIPPPYPPLIHVSYLLYI